MKTTLSKIIGSTILATGVAVSLVAAPAQAEHGNGNNQQTTPTTTTPTSTTPTTTPTTSSLTISDTTNFGFSNVFGGDTVGDGLVSQFNFDVSKTSNNKVLFQFKNTGAVSNSFISQIKFSDASNLLNFSALAPSFNILNPDAGNSVSFALDTANKNLAQSNLITNWVDSFGFSSTKQGANQAGVDQKEALGLLFDGNFDSVISSLKSNQLKIGMHVQGIYDGKSDVFASYVAPSKPPVQEVPEPTTLVGLGLAFGGMLASRRRKSH